MTLGAILFVCVERFEGGQDERIGEKVFAGHERLWRRHGENGDSFVLIRVAGECRGPPG